MDNPLVSVIIATYNRSNLLEKCLLSILDQTYPHDLFEVIVVDDGSNDDTREIVQNLIKTVEYPKIHYLYQQNSGPGAARNMGINNSKGEIIAFADDDVTVDKNWIKNALPYFSDDNIAGVEGTTYVENRKDIVLFPQNTKRKYLTCNIFYMRSILIEIGGFDSRFYMAFREDSDIAFSVIEMGYNIISAENVVAIHAPLPASYSSILNLAKKHYFDPLLYKKHKSLYRSQLERIEIGPFVIKRAYHYTCLGNILSVIIFIISIVIENLIIATISISLYVFFFFSLMFFFTRFKFSRMKKIGSMLALFVTPFVYLYWLIKGSFCFKSFIW